MDHNADPYEQKLFQMFQSCDTDGSGLLGETALRQLCQMLELRDNGATLIDDLTRSSQKDFSHSLVNFDMFKESLLKFLASEVSSNGQKAAAFGAEGETKSLYISDNSGSTYIDSPLDCSDREVSPKLVVGGKRYGRRSRPQLNVNDSSPSDSEELEYPHKSKTNNHTVQRSTSHTDIAPANRGTSALLGENKLKRCASMPTRHRLHHGIRQRNINKPSMTQIGTGKSIVSEDDSNKCLDYEQLKVEMYEIWRGLGLEVGTNRLGLQQLMKVFQRLGVPAMQAERFACACFEKLQPISKNQSITFAEFMNTLQATEHGLFFSSKHALRTLIQNALETNNKTYNIHSCACSCNFDKPRCLIFELKDIAISSETLALENIIDIWERAHISNARALLATLGFEDIEINVPQLLRVIEEELRTIETEPQMSLMKGAMVLQAAELTSLRQTFRQLLEENEKLEADNKDAKRRAAVLAQEVDERHASLEDNSKKEIHNLEQRHADILREMNARMASDHEKWLNKMSQVEAKLRKCDEEEIKLKTEVELINKENRALEEEQRTLQKQITVLLETNIKLNRELADRDDRPLYTENSSVAEIENFKSNSMNDVQKLLAQVQLLQMENARLRDKNDELLAEIEGVNQEFVQLKSRCRRSASIANTCTGSEVLAEDIQPELSDTINQQQSAVTVNAPGFPLNSELHNIATNTSLMPIANEEQMLKLRQQIALLEQEIKSLKENPREERCRELENSLEQMQKAYEDCEDYWQGKLSEERLLFDKERQIYEEEQQESDRKFTELMEKVREYEEQFSKDGRLSPIEEKAALEQQYADLEQELENLRQNTEVVIEAKTKEVESLKLEIEDLRTSLGESVEILTGANEMNKKTQKRQEIDSKSAANSPISYLWHQSTILSPAAYETAEESTASPLTTATIKDRNNLSTSETAIFSTIPLDTKPSGSESTSADVSPIQKPGVSAKATPAETDAGDFDSGSSTKSFATNTYSVHNEGSEERITSEHKNGSSTSQSPCSFDLVTRTSGSARMKEELKRLKFYEMSLKEQVKDLSMQRDGLVMELQQLQEARPVLEKAYARTAHPTLIQRVDQLELRNRHLQNVIRQQQGYTDTIMQQKWQQHQAELAELRNHIDNQNMTVAEQTQRLQNADVLVKDLYIENSHLMAAVQRLEEQRSRANFIMQRNNRNGMPGMP